MAINSFKLVLLGDPDVGKTSILLRYTDNEFSELTPSQPVSERLKKMRINGKDIVLEIWDTAGQERYKSLETHYYRDADAALLIYSVVDEESFTSVCEYWLKETQRYLPDETTIPIQLVGNKCDLVTSNASVDNIPLHDVREYTDAYGILPPIECSAKTGHNISKIFHAIASDLYRRHMMHDTHNPHSSRKNGRRLMDENEGTTVGDSCCSSGKTT